MKTKDLRDINGRVKSPILIYLHLAVYGSVVLNIYKQVQAFLWNSLRSLTSAPSQAWDIALYKYKVQSYNDSF
jgi:hypothetical protein